MGQALSPLCCRRCTNPFSANNNGPKPGGGGGGGPDAVNLDAIPPATSPTRLMRAICDFDANCSGDLSFRRGDVLEVLSSIEDEQWWRVRHFDSGTIGYVAKHYLQTANAEEAASLDCWFDVDRLESERLLRMPGLEDGTYLLRPHRQHQQELEQQHQELLGFTLSVRCAQTVDDPGGVGSFVIRHYRVLPLEHGAGFYLNPTKTCASLAELLRHYQQPASGCTEGQLQLGRPCPRVFTPPANFRDFEISRDQLELEEKVGTGCFGEVWRAKFGPVLKVAVKRMVQGSVTVDGDFVQEARLMHRLHHPKVVQLIGVCTLTEPVYIVTEYMPLGSLHSYLEADRADRRITFADMLGYLNQIADGMSYLEEQKYIHSDLRAANILVGSGQLVKVADFGLSRLVESGYYCRASAAFPVRWSAPECFAKKKFSIKSDVWSFGVVIFEVATRGELPYKDWRSGEVMKRVQQGHRMANSLAEHGLEGRMADCLYQCMLDCWHKSPRQRPSFRRLKELFADFAVECLEGYVEISR